MIRSIRALALALLLLLLAGLHAPEVAAQSTGLGGQTLGRGYWHMFVAYAIAWAVILGWVVSIARRLARIESRLDE